MHHATKILEQASEDLSRASLADYSELLAKRRVALDALTSQETLPGTEELASALRKGHAARSRLVVELGVLRAKIAELRRLNSGLRQLRPAHSTPPSLDVRL